MGTPEDEPGLEQEAEKAAEGEPLRIEKLGSGGQVLSTLITTEHTLHVAPGSYEIQGGFDTEPVAESAQVIVSTGQTLEVMLVRVHDLCK